MMRLLRRVLRCFLRCVLRCCVAFCVYSLADSERRNPVGPGTSVPRGVRTWSVCLNCHGQARPNKLLSEKIRYSIVSSGRGF